MSQCARIKVKVQIKAASVMNTHGKQIIMFITTKDCPAELLSVITLKQELLVTLYLFYEYKAPPAHLLPVSPQIF